MTEPQDLASVPEACRRFAEEVARTGRLWTIADAGGFPTPQSTAGKKSIPVWSSLTAVALFLTAARAYRGFRPCELSWKDFEDKWAAALTKDGLTVGLDWAGAEGAGFDVPPAMLTALVDSVRATGGRRRG
ncbi:MAG: DUF2750 domain-containing protein [Deltaproteobacteria bacterium]|nr:DUF2750 domain-containing protein [Deltaproteobacteria bacterium]